MQLLHARGRQLPREQHHRYAHAGCGARAREDIQHRVARVGIGAQEELGQTDGKLRWMGWIVVAGAAVDLDEPFVS